MSFGIAGVALARVLDVSSSLLHVFSFMDFHRPRLLRGLVVTNDDMAAVLAAHLCSRSSFRGVKVPIVCILEYKGPVLRGVRRVHLDEPG